MKKSLSLFKTRLKNWVGRLSTREKVIFWLCVTFSAGAILYKFPTESLLQELKITKITIAKKKIDFEKSIRKVKEAETLKKEIQPRLERANWNEPPAEIQNAILIRLERVAEEAGVKILNRKLQADKEFSFYHELSALVEFEGELKEISKLLYNLKNLPQIFDVQRLELRPLDGKQNVLRGEMLVSSVWFAKETRGK